MKRRSNVTGVLQSIHNKEKTFKEDLDRMVDKLNANFQYFMESIECRGVVELIHPENFNQIGLDIKVSFRRDQELQSLNGQVQSGGVVVEACYEK